jgi:hypothetical protein
MAARKLVEGWRTVQVREELLKKVEKKADAESRSLSNMVEVLLEEALGGKVTA